MDNKEILRAIETLPMTEPYGKSALRSLRDILMEDDIISQKMPSSSKKKKKQRNDSQESKARFLLDHERFMNQYANNKFNSIKI